MIVKLNNLIIALFFWGVLHLGAGNSFAEELNFPAVGVWNGFLSQQNVIECSNLSKVEVVFDLEVKGSAGEVLGSRRIVFAPYKSLHILLNEFDISEKYGTYLLTPVTKGKPLIHCQTVFYRAADINSNKDISYAYAIAVENPLQGVSAGTFNSMNPKGHPEPVFNWLTIYNPGQSSLSARIEVYDLEGVFDEESTLFLSNLAPGDRRDLALGHDQGQVVGSYKILPTNQNAQYGAFVTRYGIDQNGAYNFAFPLKAQAGSCDSGLVPASTMAQAYNWAEIANIKSETFSVRIEVYSREGLILSSTSEEIKSNSQRHVFLNQYLGDENVGFFRVRCLSNISDNRLLVQSLFYGAKSEDPSQLQWSYASQSRSRKAGGRLGIATPYNTFLGAANWLKIFSQSSQDKSEFISIRGGEGEFIAHDLAEVASEGSVDLPLHEAVGANQFGFASLIDSEERLEFSAELIRVFPRDDGAIGYIMNVPTRYLGAKELGLDNGGGSSSSSSSSSGSSDNSSSSSGSKEQELITPRVIQLLDNFQDTSKSSGSIGRGYFWFWNWDAMGINGADYSSLKVVEDLGNRYLRVAVSDSIPLGSTSFFSPNSLANIRSFYIVHNTATYLNPEADLVRVKVRFLRGSAGLAFGAPVSQIGNSDVMTKVKYLSADDSADCLPLKNGWLQCDFDLNEDLWRNTRRINFSGSGNNTVKNSKGEEIIHFPRWLQEPLALQLVSYNSLGEKVLSGDPIIEIDDIELLNVGKGKPFPVFESVKDVRLIEDFNSSIDSAFTVDFRFPIVQAAPVLSHSSLSASNSKSLKSVSKTAEESAWVGVNAPNALGANAVTFDIRIENSSIRSDRIHVIDFLAIATPNGEPFPWANFHDPSDYTYFLSKQGSIGYNFALYQARRILPQNQWMTVTIPFADFVAAYGSGSMVDHHREQMPLAANELAVVGWQTTYVNRDLTTSIYIDNIKYVKVPGNTMDHRSYWQGQAFDGEQ